MDVDQKSEEASHIYNPTTYRSNSHVKTYWRVLAAAIALLIVGSGLIITGILVTIVPEMGYQNYVFFITGIICFIPGAYHVVYVYCAFRGRKGYEFYRLPVFN